ENIDSRIWPRTAAIAERFWSPEEITDVEDLFIRLDKISSQLEDVGLTHVTFQEKFLRRLTNNKDTFPLKVLVDVVEPLQEYKRAGDAKKNGFEFSQYSPFTRVIDASIVDSKTVLEFNKNVNNLIEKNDKSSIAEIKSELNLLKENHSKLLPIIDSSPILFEIKPLSENLNKLAKVGLEGIEFISTKEKVSAAWKQNAENLIEESKKSYGQVEIVIVESIQKLISAIN
ncbi:MAG: beta-hexosaminidase, partial [Ignavibacteriae bacterium]|nr:beta-hexosaminidase [Ignavibacteriota bacterium]